ncbi:hypothetical protein ACI65C_013566 [Semiaphis heraclei]
MYIFKLSSCNYKMSYLKKQSKSCRCLQRKRAATQAVALLMSSSEDEDNNTDSSSESLSLSIDPVKDIPSLRLVLAQWALRCNVQHSTLNDLLQSVSIFPEFQGLPKTARTLLNTPTMVSIKHIKGVLDEKLTSLSSYIPQEFQRKPNS